MLITDFFYFSDFFSAFMRQKRAQGSPLSYRSLAKALGLQSTSSLAMVATGKRFPTDDLLQKLCTRLGLDEEQKEYARLMIAYERAKKSDEKQFFLEKMNRLRPVEHHTLDFAQLELISQWEYLLLICLAGEKNGIPSDLESLSRALNYRISVEELQDRVEHLERLNYLRRGESSELKSTDKVLATPREADRNLIKSLHQKVLGIAAEEVFQQKTEERHFSFAYMTASPKKLDRAKELLNKFQAEFDRAMAEEDENEPTEVYQLSLQFFKMTHMLEKADDHALD